ncbi:MAG: class I SAM-dependent RNA methyltransferase [Mucilaginibacter polytrichastri]|nr:class I SAM-dependent RNA methyltransferase [Mucilaginibacter polytrichastri]
MDFFHTTSAIVVTCLGRLSVYVESEIGSLGYSTASRFTGGVHLSGTLNDAIRLNLNLRCASQVLYRIGAFKARDPEELYKGVNAIAWEDIIPLNGYFSVTSNVDNPHIRTPLFANVKVKDGIVDRMKEKLGERPDSGSELSGAVIHLRWIDREAEVFIDTTGLTLSKHNYRKLPGKAPMAEALAAGCVFATGWNRKTPFINPMCGSGTLAIEAALIAQNKLPGLLREDYAFQHLIGYDQEFFFAEKRKLKAEIKKNDVKIIASDRDPQAVEIAKENARAAGVGSAIEFHVCDFAETPVPGDEGVVILNPEYGERMGIVDKLKPVYKRIGDFLKKQCSGYKGFIFTGSPELAKVIGLKAAKKTEFFSGKLDCRLLEYELYTGKKED